MLIEYLWHEEMGWHLSHRWPQTILQDMSLPVHLIGVTCTDSTYAEWDRLVSWGHIAALLGRNLSGGLADISSTALANPAY